MDQNKNCIILFWFLCAYDNKLSNLETAKPPSAWAPVYHIHSIIPSCSKSVLYFIRTRGKTNLLWMIRSVSLCAWPVFGVTQPGLRPYWTCLPQVGIESELLCLGAHRVIIKANRHCCSKSLLFTKILMMFWPLVNLWGMRQQDSGSIRQMQRP